MVSSNSLKNKEWVLLSAHPIARRDWPCRELPITWSSLATSSTFSSSQQLSTSPQTKNVLRPFWPKTMYMFSAISPPTSHKTVQAVFQIFSIFRDNFRAISILDCRLFIAFSKCLTTRKTRKSWNFWPKVENRGCFTHLYWTNCQFLWNNLLKYILIKMGKTHQNEI